MLATAGARIALPAMLVAAVNGQFPKYFCTDLALGREPLDVSVGRLDAVITDVYLDAARSRERSLPGTAVATARIAQPGFPDAPLGAIARFGCLDPGQPIPAANARIRLAGLELQPLHAVVPWRMLQALGGDTVDVDVDVAMTGEALDGTVDVATAAGHALSLRVGGTPRQPLVDAGSTRGILGDRAGEAGLSGLRRVAGTGKGVAGTALFSVAAVGSGAGKTLMGLATGLFGAAVSASKGSMSEAGVNLLGTTSATVPNAMDMLVDTGASLAAGASRTAVAAAGGDRVHVWRADVQQRWTTNWQVACTSVQSEPFPLSGSRGRGTASR